MSCIILCQGLAQMWPEFVKLVFEVRLVGCMLKESPFSFICDHSSRLLRNDQILCLWVIITVLHCMEREKVFAKTNVSLLWEWEVWTCVMDSLYSITVWPLCLKPPPTQKLLEDGRWFFSSISISLVQYGHSLQLILRVPGDCGEEQDRPGFESLFYHL